MVESEVRFNRIAMVGAFAAAIAVGGVLYALYPNSSSYQTSSETRYLGSSESQNSTVSSQYNASGISDSSSYKTPSSGGNDPGY